MMGKLFISAFVAAFLAIMAAGPAIMIPGHFELWAPLVCGQVGDGFEPKVHTYDAGPVRADGTGGGTGFEFLCGHPDGRTEDVTGRLVGTAFVGYFAVFFVLIFVIALFKKKSPPPGPPPQHGGPPMHG